MQGDCAALPLVHHLHLQPEHVAELALERLEVGVDGLGGVARARAADVGARAGPTFSRRARSSAWRTDRPLATISRVSSSGSSARGNRARMAHADIALQ